MARAVRIQYPGAIYHVTFRGNERRDLFRDDRDRMDLIRRLEVGVEAHGVSVYLVCLMTNHVHLLLATPRGNLSRFMQSLLTGYTVYFNRRHNRSGHLVQGRYGAQLVEDGDYLLGLSRYIHLNPAFVAGARKMSLAVRRDLVRRYRWSTYGSYAGYAKRWQFVEYGPILGVVTGRTGARYRDYVEAALAQTDEEWAILLKVRPAALGSEAFRNEVGKRRKILLGRRRRDDASLRAVARRYGPDDILEELARVADVEVEDFRVRRRDSYLRAYAAWGLQRYGGLTQRTIGQLLGIGSGTAVARQLKKWRERGAETKEGRRWMKKLTCRMDGKPEIA